MLASYEKSLHAAFIVKFLFGTGSCTLPGNLLEILVRSTAQW